MNWDSSDSLFLKIVPYSLLCPIIYTEIDQLKGTHYSLSGEGNGTPLQYSCLENPMDRGAWWAAVHGVTKSWTQLRDFTFTFHFYDWRRKWQPTPMFLPGEYQGQQSLVGCRLWGRTESDTWSDLAAAAAAALMKHFRWCQTVKRVMNKTVTKKNGNGVLQ